MNIVGVLGQGKTLCDNKPLKWEATSPYDLYYGDWSVQVGNSTVSYVGVVTDYGTYAHIQAPPGTAGQTAVIELVVEYDFRGGVDTEVVTVQHCP